MRNVAAERDDPLSRRAFLSATSGALVGAAALGLTELGETTQRHLQRGGTLRFATRSDVSGLDFRRNTIYLVSMPLAAISQGLLDLKERSEPVPGVATAWDVTPDLQSIVW
ncbi:MAG: twin-arginine translocation signal domain-containing protein [Candidatus Tectomicrobia bacterium]|uniref:Twin-arginine translocation signal domain-containing protein n=1 Tax=Tectimicrobiota bacterium TaxID=2528274 RepID=A0A938B6Q3_UNCTE|nr:twin-arginine translocation signal domain-containing protein [Candidatus Tectomicrobia bacterium]